MRTSIGVAAVLAGVLLLAAPAALASDGRREINQACVAAGCFPGDTAGFPVQLTTAGGYVLTSNLSVPDANTSAIQATNGVRIDLNGFEISGVTTCTGSPVTSCTPTGGGFGVDGGTRVVIENGAIRRMGSYGIGSGPGTLVENVVLEQNGGDGARGNYGSTAWIIRDSRILNNGGHGINFLYTGAAGNLVTGNTVYGNREGGITNAVGVVTNNSVAFNGDYGLYLGGNVAIGGNGFFENNGGNANPQINGGDQMFGNSCASQATCP